VVDTNGDGVADVVTGPGSGIAGEAKVYDGLTLALLDAFYAFGSSYTSGIFLG
jgi:hypothetical protein